MGKKEKGDDWFLEETEAQKIFPALQKETSMHVPQQVSILPVYMSLAA
ncbi:hypothetical protein [Agriterribacter sp.]|nr:hypothetical protein [Agriterribacter sp.]HRP54965.1 hypothetical protein [Agriterribacter sp.]